MALITTTLFKYVQSELMKNEHYEIVTPDDTKYFDPPLDFIWYDDEKQFTTKILKYDDDVSLIINDLFNGLSLEDPEHDKHFKKNFLLRFSNRQFNRQTVEAFQFELLSTFLSNEDFINRVYNDLESYVTQVNEGENTSDQTNTQLNDGKTTTDNRQAFADLPQSNTNLDVDNSTITNATDNTISKNRQTNRSESEGSTNQQGTTKGKTYSLDELFKTSGLIEQIFDIFDKKCFIQVW